MWTMRVVVRLIVVCALGMVFKGLERKLDELEIRGRIETIQITALLRMSEYCDKSWRTEETSGQSESSERPPANTGAKNARAMKLL